MVLIGYIKVINYWQLFLSWGWCHIAWHLWKPPHSCALTDPQRKISLASIWWGRLHSFSEAKPWEAGNNFLRLGLCQGNNFLRGWRNTRGDLTPILCILILFSYHVWNYNKVNTHICSSHMYTLIHHVYIYIHQCRSTDIIRTITGVCQMCFVSPPINFFVMRYKDSLSGLSSCHTMKKTKTNPKPYWGQAYFLW